MAHEAVRQAEATYGPFEVRELDISQHPEVVREYGVVTTPSLVINGQLLFSGVPKVTELIEKLKNVQSGE